MCADQARHVEGRSAVTSAFSAPANAIVTPLERPLRPDRPDLSHNPSRLFRLTGFGHSHLSTFQRAWKARQRAGVPADPDLILSFLGDRTVGPNFVDCQPTRTVAPGLRDAVARTLETSRPDAVFCILMGNEYNALAMVRHTQAFDFDLPGEPDRDPDVPAISAAQMRAQLTYLAARNALLVWSEIARQAEAVGAKVYLLPPPPPIPSTDHIRAHPGAFGDLVARHGLNPAPLRRKMWLLYCDALRIAVRDTATTFLDLPDAIFENGFLAKQFWQADPTHANGTYGEIMLSLVADLAKQDARA